MSETTSMNPGRLEAFSDGVLAIIITIMVLEIKPPHGHELSAWTDSIPTLLAYMLSFTFIAMYWNNHHHLLRAVKKIDPSAMWANMILLFFLSLVPVLTAWIGEESNYTHIWPAALYGILALLNGLAFKHLSTRLEKANPDNRQLAELQKSPKIAISIALYSLGVVLAFFGLWQLAFVSYVLVSLAWFIPDKRLVS